MEEEYPPLIDRIQSSFIDLGVIFITAFVITSILDGFEQVPDGVRIVLFLGLLLYEPLCMCFGGTLGNYIKKIRVKKNADSRKSINFFQSILRYIVKISLGWVSFLTINSNPRRRALHDMASGTVMLKV